MAHNRAVIYSNGIADFHRHFFVSNEEPKEIAIPVRRDHIGDVLASLNVYGDVALKSPPSFRPSNEAEGSLSIETNRVIEGLATSLGGARVAIERGGETNSGTLIGLHQEQEATGGDRVETQYLVIQTDEGIKKIPIKEIQNLRFDDETIRSEINKALQRNYQSIKPHSTFVELTLETEQDATEAIVQYTIPAAAWKISYRLRQKDDEAFEFQGFAIVDNNTDEDWNDFLISVVTGDPITFSTDLADSKTPGRRHVDVVKDVAIGAVEVEDASFGSAFAQEGQAMLSDYSRLEQMARSQDVAKASSEAYVQSPSARTQEADVREVGDFSIYESQTSVSIGANRSAIIPIFNTMLGQSKTVLHYKSENHRERSFRAVQFKNETSQSLGRGVCTVFQDGTYVGSCIMSATKPGGDALLPYALETGVRLRRESKKRRQKQVALQLSEGYCYTSTHQTQSTVYLIKNHRDEQFELFLDHDYVFQKPKLECTVTRSDGPAVCEPTDSLKNGFRISLAVAPNEELSLKVVESRVDKSSIQLVNATQDSTNMPWLINNLVATNGPLANDPGIRKCLEIQQRLDAKREQVVQAESEKERLESRQARLRDNIKAGGHDDQTSRWKTDLGKAEDKLVQLEDETIPNIKSEEIQIKKELQDGLMALAAEWTE